MKSYFLNIFIFCYCFVLFFFFYFYLHKNTLYESSFFLLASESDNFLSVNIKSINFLSSHKKQNKSINAIKCSVAFERSTYKVNINLDAQQNVKAYIRKPAHFTSKNHLNQFEIKFYYF